MSEVNDSKTNDRDLAQKTIITTIQAVQVVNEEMIDVLSGGMPNSRRKRRHQPHVQHVREARGDDVGAAPNQDRVA